MCNRYRMTARQAELARHFGVEIQEDLTFPVGDLFPKRQGFVARVEQRRLLEAMTWGFPPPGASKAPVTNVRNLSSPFWRTALSRPDRRCLVPVTSFCEWEGETGSKIDRWFTVTAEPVFAFAGVWRPTGEGTAAYAFLTCDPNPLVAAVHPKAMPVILHPEDYDHWLGGSFDEVTALAAPFPSQLMAMY